MANNTICSFTRDWMDKKLNPRLSSWLKEVATGISKVHCFLCSKNFELSSIGREAVTSHIRSSALHMLGTVVLQTQARI